MKISRRNLLQTALFGAGYVGLRALVSGVPAAVLMKGTRALAAEPVAPTCADPSKAQFVIFATAGSGDPLNANVPGSYVDPNIAHPTDWQTPTPMTLNGVATAAAAPWAAVPQTVLDRSTFWHIMTNTPVHPKEPDVLGLVGTTTPSEMLPSLLSRQLAPCLNTLQAQPICVGAASPSEGLRYGGQALPIIPPLALKATLANPGDGLLGVTNLQSMRDQALAQLDGIYRSGATKAQKAYLDSLVTSQQQVRGIRQDLLDKLSGITDNTLDSQTTAAVALILMKVSPVISIHIPFGGDNHNDTLLAKEEQETTDAVSAIITLMQRLDDAQLTDSVSLMTLNVFGRTLGPDNTDGRQHNPNHQVSLAIGKPFKGGVIGGVASLSGVPANDDYSAQAIDSTTGAASGSGDIARTDTLASYGKTMLAAVGGDPTAIDGLISSGKIVQGALASS